jgi:methylmalonyl-CoA mutase cobalamin-binding domain/chain
LVKSPHDRQPYPRGRSVSAAKHQFLNTFPDSTYCGACVRRMLEDVQALILEMADVEALKQAITDHLAAGVDPQAVVDALRQTLEAVGAKYEAGEFFLSELIMAGYLASEVAALLKPHLQTGQQPARGTVVMGTVRGDIHDIGKNIVIMMLDAAGFEVLDLGVDVATERFVEAVQTVHPDVLGISALLTSTMDRVPEILAALQASGLRDRVKVIVGGRPITPAYVAAIGADGYAEDAVKVIRLVKDLVGDQGVPA